MKSHGAAVTATDEVMAVLGDQRKISMSFLHAFFLSLGAKFHDAIEEHEQDRLGVDARARTRRWF
jgi:hypothetical protein